MTTIRPTVEADFPAIAAGLVEVETGDGGRLAIVPGLTCENEGVPDVMRGEETQIAGALASEPSTRLVILPGTHSKWAVIDGGRVSRFTSFMTGEVFAVLSRLDRHVWGDPRGPSASVGLGGSLGGGSAGGLGGSRRKSGSLSAGLRRSSLEVRA